MTQPSPVARFFGYAMIAIGVLMALLSGACTVTFLFMSLAPKAQGGDTGLIWVSLGMGLPFVAIGIGLVIGGRALSRRRGPKEPPSEVF